MIVSFFLKSDNGHAIVSQEKRSLPKSTARFPAKAEDSSLLSRRIALELSSPPPPPMQSVRADGRTLTSKSKISLRFAYPWCTDGAFRVLVSAMMKAILFILFDGIYVTSGC